VVCRSDGGEAKRQQWTACTMKVESQSRNLWKRRQLYCGKWRGKDISSGKEVKHGILSIQNTSDSTACSHILSTLSLPDLKEGLPSWGAPLFSFWVGKVVST